jgi:hypothetical protein
MSEDKKTNWFIKHKVITGLLVIILILLIGSSGSKSNSGSKQQDNTKQTYQDTPKLSKINEVATSGEVSFTVIKVTEAKTLGQYFSRDAQGIFKIITLKIENNGKETKTIDSSMIKLKDSKGRTFERSIDGQTAKGIDKGKVDLFLQQVQPGLGVTGDIVFDIPKESTGLVLTARSGLLAGDAEISLE